MIFKTPFLLILAPFVVAFFFWLRKKRKPSAVLFPTRQLLTPLGPTWKTRLSGLPFYLRIIALALFGIALAGPRTFSDHTQIKTEGIDIVLAIDTSTSMLAEDFTLNGTRYNRLQVVKKVVEDFISGRSYDRIGLIAFAGRAYTVSPLTTDYSWLKANLERVDFEMIEDGTAIGSAVASSVSRLEKSDAKSKVIILLTDGVNNAGDIDPVSAAKLAQALKIKIYTVGAGTKGLAPYPVRDIWGGIRYQQVQIDIDEGVLRKIADMTKGRYFRATDTHSLLEIYHEIDQMEKTEIEESGYREYNELFRYFLVAGLMILLLEQIFSNIFLLKVP